MARRRLYRAWVRSFETQIAPVPGVDQIIYERRPSGNLVGELPMGARPLPKGECGTLDVSDRLVPAHRSAPCGRKCLRARGREHRTPRASGSRRRTLREGWWPMSFKIPVYDVRLIRRRTLSLAEETIGNTERAARALHALIGLTDREHLACLFLNGAHGVTGAHIAAVGGTRTPIAARLFLSSSLFFRESPLGSGRLSP
jgi:hypothetical protein